LQDALLDHSNEAPGIFGDLHKNIACSKMWVSES